MSQATGKSGQYRYYKCATRLGKHVDGCGSHNLLRERTDALVLSTLAEKVFTEKRVKLMLEQMAKRQRASRTVEDQQLLVLRKEEDEIDAGLGPFV